jgi:hypothetical protein
MKIIQNNNPVISFRRCVYCKSKLEIRAVDCEVVDNNMIRFTCAACDTEQSFADNPLVVSDLREIAKRPALPSSVRGTPL